MNHETASPASLAAECQRRYQRHWGPDAADRPAVPMNLDQADAVFLSELPGAASVSLRENGYRYRIGGKVSWQDRECTAIVVWGNADRREYVGKTWELVVEKVRADIGRMG